VAEVPTIKRLCIHGYLFAAGSQSQVDDDLECYEGPFQGESIEPLVIFHTDEIDEREDVEIDQEILLAGSREIMLHSQAPFAVINERINASLFSPINERASTDVLGLISGMDFLIRF